MYYDACATCSRTHGTHGPWSGGYMIWDEASFTYRPSKMIYALPSKTIETKDGKFLRVIIFAEINKDTIVV